MNDRIPLQIGKYPVSAILGRGATSTVFRARDPFGQRDVAIKFIDPGVFDSQEDALAKTGFLVEAGLVGRLNHPHVTRIFDVVDHPSQHFVVMEYVPGGTLERYCQPGSLMDTDSAIDVVFKAAKALEHVHSLGLVHRDIKPANILLYEGTDIRVTDFGAALARNMTQTQMIKAGSPLWMSPEQIKGEEVGFFSDMYSVGIVLYQLLTGQPPFQAGSLDALAYQIVQMDPQPPSTLRPGLPARVDDFVYQATRKRPEDRFGSWQEFCAGLTGLVDVASTNAAEISLDSQTGRFNLLRRNPFFAEFDDPLLWEVLENARFQRMVEGDVIMREGDVGDKFLVILAGEVRVIKSGRLLNLLTTGSVIGEMSYILESRRPRSATCVTFSGAILLEVRDEWLKNASLICRSCFERTFMRQLAVRLFDTNSRLVHG